MNGLLRFIVLASGLLVANTADAADETVRLLVKNMTCASCPYIVKKSLTAVPGVRSVEVSFEEKMATVAFDNTKTSVAALTAATRNGGYPSTVEK